MYMSSPPGRGRPRKIHYKEEEHLCTEDEPCFENCGVCKETVPNDCAMLCDGICSNWYHLKCVELTDEDYISINLMADKISWFCKACDPKIKSFIKSRASSEADQIDDINALRGTVEVLLKEVKGIVNDNVMINAKMDQLIDKKISSTPNVVSESVMPSWSKMKNSYGRGRGRGLRDTNTSLNTNIMKNQGNYSQTQSILSADLEDVTENQSNNSNVHIDSVNRLPNTHLNSVSVSHNIKTIQSRQYKAPKYDFSKDTSTSQRKSRNELKDVIIGKKTDSFIKTIPVRPRPTRRKALFISRLCPEVSASDIEGYIKHEVTLDFVKCSQLRTKYEDYASFHIEVNETDMDKVLNADIWPSGCLLTKFKGVLRKEAVINGTSSNEHFLPMEDNSQSSTQTES
ncbi:hypothetical protein J6590_050876 [Homalodisca vitripennis]|nr:hypothetical protein J6590_050876 [Homalodisca vitripennis]